MNLKKLLPISLLSLGMLIGCGGSNTPAKEPFPDEKQDGSHVVEVTNLTDLQKEWYDDGEPRNVTVTISEDGKPQNISQAIKDKKLKLIVQDDSVFGTTGLAISPKIISEKTKTTKVAVKYFDTVKHIELTLTHRKTPKEYGAKHDGTLKDPLTNEDALLIAKAQKAEGSYADVEYYIGGTVASFYHAPGTRDDKVCSWFLKPAEKNGEKFEIYRCKKTDGAQWTNDDIWKGAYTVAHGKFADYNGQYETAEAILDSVTGEKPGPQQTIQATVAQALEVGKALDDGDSTYDFYEVTGYVVKKDGTNYFMSDTQEVAADDKDMLELYRVGTDDQPKMLKNAKIKAKINLKNYHDQIEDSGTKEITVIEPGEEWPSVKPEPAMVTGKKIADFAADASGDYKQLYELNVKVTKWYKDTGASEFGDMYVSDEDGTNELVIYGSTATATALTWSSTDGKYIYSSPKDFLTNELTKEIKVGDTLTIKATRGDYQGKVQARAIITAVNGGTPEPPVPTDEYGTAENPLTVEEAKALLDKVAADGSVTTKELYITGKVTSAEFSTKYSNWTIWLSSSDGTTAQFFELYATLLADGLNQEDLVAEAVVVAHGYGQIYTKGEDKTYELTRTSSSNPTIISINGVGPVPPQPGELDPLAAPIALDFSGVEKKQTELTADELTAILNTAAGDNASHLLSNSGSKVYAGNTSTSGAYPSSGGNLKFGTSSATGSLTLKFDGLVNQVQITCHDWYTKNDEHPTNSNTVAVNGGLAQLAPYTVDATAGVLTFELAEASDTIEIVTANRIFCFSITVSYVTK